MIYNIYNLNLSVIGYAIFGFGNGEKAEISF